MHYIRFDGVSKIYNQGGAETRALSEASFSVEKGEFCVIVGRSGAGKTTILNILGGMDTATKGDIVVDGDKISQLSQRELCAYRRGKVGFVFQFYNLVPNLTALENVELASEICANPLDPMETLERLGLKDKASSFPAQLSGGEQQRVSIARALAKNPKLLLCDEPTGALDDETGRQVLSLLCDTSKETDMTVILITHNTAITQIARRVIRVKNGSVAETIMNENPKTAAELEW